jgi:MtfA peptidase
MDAGILLLTVAGLIIAAILVYPYILKWHRDLRKSRPFPHSWQVIIDRVLPFYTYLSPLEQRHLQGHIQVFLAEKQYIGCAGLQITLEIKVTIAAIACLLL